MSTWTLLYNGLEQTLEQWGIANPRCKFRSFAADEFTFQIPLADALTDPAFPYGSAITLKKDGTAWFIGTVSQEQSSLTRHREQHPYVVSGPWWQLARTLFQQYRCVKSSDFSTTSSQYSTRVILGQSDLGTRLTTSDQISAVVTYALTKGVALAAGSIADGIAFPYQEARDITCAEAIMRMARRTPDCVSWFDYSSGVATLNIRRRASLSSASLSCLAANLLEELNVIARHDLVPPGVRFIFVTSTNNPADNTAYTQLTVQSVGAPDSVGGIIATIEPMGEGTDRPEQIPTTLASDYYTLLSVLPYQGSLRTKAAECAGTLRPGKVLNLTSGRTAWSTMNALIQTVSEELFTGVTEVEFGPPDQLGPQDFIEQLIFNRQAPFITDFYRVRNCSNATGKNEGDPASGGDTGTTNTKAGVAPGSIAARTNDVFNSLKRDHSVAILVCDPDTGEEGTVCVIGATGAC